MWPLQLMEVRCGGSLKTKHTTLILEPGIFWKESSLLYDSHISYVCYQLLGLRCTLSWCIRCSVDVSFLIRDEWFDIVVMYTYSYCETRNNKQAHIIFCP